jgi:hypothetical protein
MLKTVKDACRLHDSVLDGSREEQIENLAVLLAGQQNGADFFAKTYVTQGMRDLLGRALTRLGGGSAESVYMLTQAMGGGKTHLMIALGLLAQDPALRTRILRETGIPFRGDDFGSARVVTFTGRNNPEHHIWGEIALQLGRFDEYKRLCPDGSPPDTARWAKLIGNEPSLILLDELPPYLSNARTVALGNGTLADRVTYTLGCLFDAIKQLDRCVVVMANLSVAYEQDARALARLMRDLQAEGSRGARNITPVKLGGDEVVNILRKRLFAQLPSPEEIDEVADRYADDIAAAIKGHTIGKSAEKIVKEIRDSYPFHPSMEDLIALFKENESFRQTRGLIQFVAQILRSVWRRPTNDVFLVGVQHLDLTIPEVLEEVRAIAVDLDAAIAKDIASGGAAHAQLIDQELRSDAGTQVANTLFVASLARGVNVTKGLSRARVIECLVAPNRTTDEFQKAFDKLKADAWYLHSRGDAFFFARQENLTKRLIGEAERAPGNKIDDEIRRRLDGIFRQIDKIAYERHLSLPRLDEIDLRGGRMLLVVSPDSKTPPAEMARFFGTTIEKNNLLIVTGDGSDLVKLEGVVRDLYAIAKVKGELDPSDPLRIELAAKEEEAELKFLATIRETFTRIYFPGVEPRTGTPILRQAALNLELTRNGGMSAEKRIEELLASTFCSKLVLDLAQDGRLDSLRGRLENTLWPKEQKRIAWRDIQVAAISNPRWIWLPPKGMETIRREAELRGHWRCHENGDVERGPFAKEPTSIRVTVEHRDEDTGAVRLKLTPLNAGPKPVIHVASDASVSVASPVVNELTMTTDAARLFFLVVDPSGEHPMGEPVEWRNQLTVRYQARFLPGGREVELQVTPRGIIRFTTDGTSPTGGRAYTGRFPVGLEKTFIRVLAEDQGVTVEKDFILPPAMADGSGGNGLLIDDTVPARLRRQLRTADVPGTFRAIEASRKAKARLLAVTIEAGHGDRNLRLIAGSGIELGAADLDGQVAFLKRQLWQDDAAVALRASGAHFASGADLRAFACELGLELEQKDIEQ